MQFRENKNMSLRRINKVFLIGMVLFTVLIMTGATQKRLNLPKLEKVLWTGYWDTWIEKDGSSYEYYCVISEIKQTRKLTIYKPTSKGYKKIYSYSDDNYFIKAYPDASENSQALNTYWEGCSARIYRVFEYEPVKDIVKMTFEIAFKDEPERFYEDNWDSYLIVGDEESSFITTKNTLSYETAIFYRRIPGQGYSKNTTSKWKDRYLMMDSISKQSTSNASG